MSIPCSSVDHRRAYTKLLHKRSISQTDCAVAQRILSVRVSVGTLPTRLVVDTKDHEAVIGDCVNEVLTTHLDRVDGEGGRGEGE